MTSVPGRNRARLERHESDTVMEIEDADDTTVTPGPAQLLLPEFEEEEDEQDVLFKDNTDDKDADEGMVSDYESDTDCLTEEMVLEKRAFVTLVNSLSVLK